MPNSWPRTPIWLAWIDFFQGAWCASWLEMPSIMMWFSWQSNVQRRAKEQKDTNWTFKNQHAACSSLTWASSEVATTATASDIKHLEWCLQHFLPKSLVCKDLQGVSTFHLRHLNLGMDSRITYDCNLILAGSPHATFLHFPLDSEPSCPQNLLHPSPFAWHVSVFASWHISISMELRAIGGLFHTAGEIQHMGTFMPHKIPHTTKKVCYRGGILQASIDLESSCL